MTTTTQDLRQRHQAALKDIEAHNCGDELCQSGMKPCTKLAALFAEVKWLKVRLADPNGPPATDGIQPLRTRG